MSNAINMLPDDLEDLKQYARDQLEFCLDEIKGNESPDMIHLKMKGYGQRVTAVHTHLFMQDQKRS